MWGLEALRHEYDVALVTGTAVDPPGLEQLNAFYGTAVPWGSFRVREVRPPLGLPFRRAAGLWGAWFTRQCRRMAKDYDVVISAYNPADIGKAAVHIVADFSWDPELASELDPTVATSGRLLHRKGPLRSAYLHLCRQIAPPTGRDLFAGKDLLLANSGWTADLLRQRFSAKRVEVLYPPVVAMHSHIPWEDRENGFVCLGRVSPEKGIESIIDILRRVRAHGHDVHLHVAGPIGSDPYGQKIAVMCHEHRDWIFIEGSVQGDRKNDILAHHRYGIHARPQEAFGIAVAEMASAGCVPFVPLGGGQVEIVGDSRLCYRDVDDAVQKVCAFLDDRTLQEPIQDSLRKQAAAFLPDRFVERFRAAVRRFHTAGCSGGTLP